jgi:hypothetical protein
MLLSTQELRSKRAGILALRMNQEVYPCSINLKCKLDIPPEMKDDAESIENTQAWNDYRTEVKKNSRRKS